MAPQTIVRTLKEYRKRSKRSERKTRGSHRYWWFRGQLALYFCEPRIPIDRTDWAPGPWDGEPDWERWQHKGLACVVMRSTHGSWLGYLNVPKGHPWRKIPQDDIDACAHGGLTFSDQLGADYWIGFDCAHYNDHSPGLAATLRRIAPYDGLASLTDGAYRDLAYVRANVEALAEQAADTWQAN